MSKVYKIHEFAQMAGVTVRALHHYDRLGVLRPQRTQAGYRVYCERDLEQLEKIVALKFLGLPLKQIKLLLEQDGRGLAEVLRAQRMALEEKRRRLEQAISAIREAEDSVTSSSQADAAALRKIIEVIEMQNDTDFLKKYYSEEAWNKLAGRRTEWTPELQEQTTRAWSDLFRDVEAALGEDPASEKAQALGVRWKKLIEAFTGGDKGIASGAGKVWADRQNLPAANQQQMAPFNNQQVWEFMAKVLKCAK